MSADTAPGTSRSRPRSRDGCGSRLHLGCLHPAACLPLGNLVGVLVVSVRTGLELPDSQSFVCCSQSSTGVLSAYASWFLHHCGKNEA